MIKDSLTSYIDSKRQLYEAIQKDPVYTTNYEITKYCRMATGLNKQLKEYQSLKPKQVVSIEWRYCADGTSTPLRLITSQLVESEDPNNLLLYKPQSSILKWISTNAVEIL